MTDVSRYSVGRRMLPDTPVASAWPTHTSAKLATRVDIALLISALFLQRFSLPFRSTFLHLDLVAIGLILFYQFWRGKVLIQYNRLLWFVPFSLAASLSYFLNSKSTLTGYLQFMVFYSLFSVIRPSEPGQYKRTLHAFQNLVILLSCLGIVQYLAHFVIDSARLMNLYGIFPDSVFEFRRVATPFRSNGIFLSEGATLGAMTTLGILIEVLEFGRPRCLLIMMLGFLASFSGIGAMFLLIFLPLASLRDGKAVLSLLFVGILALGLIAAGMIDLSRFTSRVGEFSTPGASGYARFISPFLLAADQFDSVPLHALLVGSGPGTVNGFASASMNVRDTGGFAATWIKILYEYGIIGSFLLCCFLAACLRKSRCPALVVVAIVFSYVFLQGLMTIAIPLCTLNGPEPRRSRIDETSQYRSRLVAGAEPV